MSRNRKDSQDSGPDPYYTVAKAARLLGISRPTVLARVARGELKSEIIAERPVILRESVDRALAQQTAAA